MDCGAASSSLSRWAIPRGQTPPRRWTQCESLSVNFSLVLTEGIRSLSPLFSAPLTRTQMLQTPG